MSMCKIGRRAMLGMAIGTLLVTAGCALFPPSSPEGGSPEAWEAIASGAPVRAAVYVGPGARGVGQFRWMQIMDQSPDVVATYVDGAAIRGGALRFADVVVMPGGKSNIEADELGEAGQRELRRFIEQGGAYVGTCAGAFLMMHGDPKPGKDGKPPKEKILGIAPYKHRSGGWGGEAMLQVEYTEEAAKLFGVAVKKGKGLERMERFNGGPVMDPITNAVPGADFKVMARFKSNLHSYSSKPNMPSMGGGASSVAGTFGKGRVWLFAGHPEYYPQTWPSVKAAFKFLTGRDIKIDAPQRKRDQLAVGWWCKPGPGPIAAELARELVRSADFDVVPYSNDEILRTDLRHVDALVVPDAADTNVVAKLAGGAMMAKFTAFMERGGRVVTWGRAASAFKPHANLVVVRRPGNVARKLLELKSAPLPPPRKAPPPKNANAVRTAFYAGPGASGCAAVRWIKMLSLSPDCDFTVVNAEDVRNGALKDVGLYIAPGGMSSTQAQTLKPEGCSNLVEYVRAGGGYFGTCAGCYLAMSLGDSKKTSGRLGMMPYKAQLSPYRGGCDNLTIKFTDNADMFGLKPGSKREVRYHGGPVPVPCEAIPGADIRVVATFACDGVYSYNTNTAPVMAGYPAVLAGTFGKGRIACTSPHPESFTHTQDIIRGGLKYVTGREFKSEYPQRTRGNLSVGFLSGSLRKDSAILVSQLYREASLDIRAVAGETINYGELEHCDALVLPHPSKGKFSRLVCDFAKKGGIIFAFGSVEEMDAIPADLPNVVRCADGEAVRKVLVECAKEGR